MQLFCGIYWYIYYLQDVNECILENGGCAENCVNTIGSYRCQCSKHGYQMVPGKTYCEGLSFSFIFVFLFS